MGSWNDNWNNSWDWFESNSLENKLSRVTKEHDEIFTKLKYIDSRQVADKLAEEE